jgi:uncharacterized protein (DUF1501 family)
MLTILGKSQQYGRNLSRRDFLKVGSVTGMLSLAEALRCQALAKDGGAVRAAAKKSVIMVYLLGGPAHLDTYDPKPNAPAEYRGEFKPIHTNVPGIQISELFPRQAAMMDKFSLIRSLSASTVNNHSDSEVMTGRHEIANSNFQYPCIGSIVSKLREAPGQSVPGYVALRKMSFPTKTPLPQSLYYLNSAALGRAHAPLLPTGEAMGDFDFAPSIDAQRFRDRMDLLSRFDLMRRDLDASGNMAALDAFQGKALDILTSRRLRDALDLSQEDPRIVQRYSLEGGPVNSLFATGYKQGAQLLLARRLIEAGVGFVEVALGYWDTHGPASVLGFPHLRNRLCPVLDQSLTALVEDLHQRGMEKDVVVIVWGEFGRSPKINNVAGRDHWLPVLPALVTGGGLKTGQLIGATDNRGEYVIDKPYTISNMLSTIYRAIGIDPATTFVSNSGRPTAILDDREPIRELL